MGGLFGRQHVPVGLGAVEWSCHVCGATRPDAEVGVISRERTLQPRGALEGVPGLGIPMKENLRYCLVTDACREAAEAWAAAADTATSWRDPLPERP